MSILKYLPTFKIVEVNRSTGLVSGHVIAQFPLAADSSLIKNVQEDVNVLENGAIVELKDDLTVDGVNGASAQPFLVFTEELNTFMDGLKYFADAADAQGEIYPRGIALYVGDVFTTDNYTGELSGAKFAKVVNGVLTLQTIADNDTLFAVEESTLPLGDDAGRFIYIGSGVRA